MNKYIKLLNKQMLMISLHKMIFHKNHQVLDLIDKLARREARFQEDRNNE